MKTGAERELKFRGKEKRREAGDVTDWRAHLLLVMNYEREAAYINFSKPITRLHWVLKRVGQTKSSSGFLFPVWRGQQKQFCLVANSRHLITGEMESPAMDSESKELASQSRVDISKSQSQSHSVSQLLCQYRESSSLKESIKAWNQELQHYMLAPWIRKLEISHYKQLLT